MSLTGALNIGKTALAVHQAAIQVTSNNVANAGNPDYTRQSALLTPTADQMLRPGLFVGTGVNLASIQRNIDEALESRLRASISDGQAAATRQQWLARAEAIFNELGDDDLSSQLSAFFNSWSGLANKPQDLGLRQVVLQSGESLAATFRNQRTGIERLQVDIDSRLGALVRNANGLADQIADLNSRISQIEAGGGGTANGLRDQRDTLLKQLSELVHVKVQDTGNGVVNVLVGSDPLILGDTNRGLALRQESRDGILIAEVVNASDGGAFRIAAGQVGALLSLRSEIDSIGASVDSLAGQLIFELNKLHSSGQGLEGLSQAAASNAVRDPAAALNSDDAGLKFQPVNGSFVVHLREKSTGLVTSTLVQVDLDGLNGDDTSLESLRASLDGIDGLSATIAAGKLRLQTTTSAVELSFSQDTSGALAALGIGSFFTGTTGRDIAVSADVKARPASLAASRNGEPGDNQTALAIAALETRAIPGLNRTTLQESYESLIGGLAASAAGARTAAEAAAVITETLITQREALSGVSLDEEAVNLMREQRAFQGAARIIAAIDELMRTLLQLV